MGKKNKKSRRHDDDDLLGPPSTNQQDELNDDDDDDDVAINTSAADADASAVATDDTENASPKPDKKKKGGASATTQKLVNINLPLLEETMTNVLRNYGGNSDDWLYRTLEKNMHLPKHSLRQSLEPHVLEEMMARVQQNLDGEYDEEGNKKKRWDCLVAEMCKKSELTAEDKAKLWAEAQGVVGVDREEAVAMVIETIRNAAKKQKDDDGTAERKEDEGAPGDLDGLDASNASLSVSLLLTLQPYLQQSSLHHSSFGKIVLIVRRCICLLLYNVLSLLLGHQAKTRAIQIYERIHLPSIKAAQLAKEREEDDQMLRTNTHLWSNQQQGWIEKDETYSHPSAPLPPPTIRWNTTRNQWERWSKNLTTRTKAMKQAEAAGTSTAFTKGTFVSVRAGEGWATAPDQPEVEKDRIGVGGIRFFVCLPPGKTGEGLEVVDVTCWAAQTVLPKEAARELEAVDSGRELFSLDVSSLLLDKKGGKKGKGKSHKKKKQNKDENVGEEEEANSVTRKGVGCTAKISEKYMERMSGN